jgi:hypothetical protein
MSLCDQHVDLHVRDTDAKPGRTRSVSPDTTSMRQLHYGRIILDANDAALTVDPQGFETGLICLRIGNGLGWWPRIRHAPLTRCMPRETVFRIAAGSHGCDSRRSPRRLTATTRFSSAIRRRAEGPGCTFMRGAA